jgi:hypothetical protein
VSQLRAALAHHALRRPGGTVDNITLVPASLLPFKARYEKLARTLPAGTMLLVPPRRQPQQRRLLVRLSRQFTTRHQIATRTVEEVARR